MIDCQYPTLLDSESIRHKPTAIAVIYIRTGHIRITDRYEFQRFKQDIGRSLGAVKERKFKLSLYEVDHTHAHV